MKKEVIQVAKVLIDDKLWESLRPLLPPSRPRRTRHPGRKPLDDRRVLTGILFVLKSGIAWEDLPVEMGCGCGMTCLNRLRAWQQAGAWPALRKALQGALPWADRIDWGRAETKPPPRLRFLPNPRRSAAG
jgi:transposase